MSDYVFPFDQLNYLNDFYSDEILPYDRYCRLVADYADHESDYNTYNPADIFDENLVQSNNVSCEYIDLNDFLSTGSNGKFSVLHMNINSLPKHLSELTANFTDLTNLPDIIALSETKLNHSTESLYSIGGYNSIFNSNSSQSGGLAFFIKSNLKYTILENKNHSFPHIEILCISIAAQPKPITICLIYRRPSSNIDQFLEHYQNLLRELRSINGLIIGDINLDLLRYENSSTVKKFVDVNFEFFFP